MFPATGPKSDVLRKSAISVVIVDDHVIVSESLAAILDHSPLVEVIGIAKDLRESLELMSIREPDVLLVDVNMPDRSGFELVRELRRKHSKYKTLFLTGYPSATNVELAVRSGANGLILKNCSISFLVSAIHAISSGERVFDPDLKDVVEFDESGEVKLREPSSFLNLTERQVEIVRELAKGHSVKQIAQRLHLSPKTVDNHKYRIMKILNIHDRVELARIAIREGLLEP